MLSGRYPTSPLHLLFTQEKGIGINDDARALIDSKSTHDALYLIWFSLYQVQYLYWIIYYSKILEELYL